MSDPDDAFLMAAVRGGDDAALRRLIERYDRLVRYVIYRSAKSYCLKDPTWLDGVASSVWHGFVRSLRRGSDALPDSAAGYLARIARNQVVSEMRREGRATLAISIHADDEAPELPGPGEDPADVLARVELLDALQTCLRELDADDRTLAGQLRAITERRWREAGEALGLKESTLRSRWERVLERLRACIRRKTGKNLARDELSVDF